MAMLFRKSSSEKIEEGARAIFDQKSLSLALVVIAAGLAAVFLYSLQAKSLVLTGSILAVGTAIAGASLLVGALLGFLFGIPRRLQREGVENRRTDASREENEFDSRALYGGNTNLEQISDWLTKILVGVGLVQISKLGEIWVNIGNVAGSGMGGFASSQVFSMAIVMYFAISGFLLGYLWTRLYLGRALTDAERAYTLKKKLDKFEQQSHADARALRLSTQQLTNDEDGQPLQSELDEAIMAASSDTRGHIFYRAQHQRWRNWRNEFTKPIMERTVPIFRALAASDVEHLYHTNYGQLGFALKDQRHPDWKAAEEALSRAIAHRGDAEQYYWHSYEFNRAICRVMQDKEFSEGKPSKKEMRSAILSDLKIAMDDDEVMRWIIDHPKLGDWFKANSIDITKLN